MRLPVLVVFFAAGFAMVLAAPAWAQVVALPGSQPVTVTKQGVYTATTRVAVVAPTGPIVHEMTVYPAAEPDPALKYRLRLLPLEQKAGNALLLWGQAIQLLGDRKDRQDDLVSKWMALPLSDLPVKEAEEALGRASSALRYAYLASLRSRVEWEFPIEEGISMLMPSLSDYRYLARLLAVQARLQMAQGHFDEAIGTLRTGFMLADAMGRGETLINGLVGIAIESLMYAQVETLVQQKGAPNLYWALADLPRPLVDLKEGLDYERLWMSISMPELKPENRNRITPAQWQEILAKVQSWCGDPSQNSPAPRGPLVLLSVMRDYDNARKYLREQGIDPARIEKMASVQVVGLYWLSTYEHWMSEMKKWHYLPYWQAKVGVKRSTQRLEEWVAQQPANPFRMIIPSLSRALLLQTRCERTHAALQTIEAIREYAAGHDGRPPRSLDDLELPAPIDPMTGKGFVYSAKGRTFMLRLDDEEPSRSQIYSVTIK